MDRETVKLVSEHDVKIKDITDEVTLLKAELAARQKKDIIRDYLFTRCIWVWTSLLAWCFGAGVYIAEHFDRVSIIAIAVFKALKEGAK